MKILHITPNKNHTCLFNFIKNQAKRHEVILAVLNLSEDIYGIGKEYINGNMKCLEITAKKIIDFSYDNKLKIVFDRVMKKYHPDFVHIHLFSGISAIPILNVACSLEIKRVITSHDHSLICLRGTCHNGNKKCKINSLQRCNCAEAKYFANTQKRRLGEYNRLREGRIKNIIDMCDKLIFCSQAQERMVSALFGNNPKFVTLYYGVDLPKAQKTIEKKSGRITFGYLGSMHPLKGVDTIIKAVKYLNKYDFNIIMAVRHKKNDQYAHNILAKLKSTKRVKIIKNIMYKDFYALFFSKIDYLIIPSLWEETGPMTLFESFFYKVPVIIANQESMVEKIKGNKSSKIFANSLDLTQIMKKIIKGEIKKIKNDNFRLKGINEYGSQIESLYKDSINKRIRTLKLKTGYLCNNRCIFCVTGDNSPGKFVDFELIKKSLLEYRKTYDRLILTGGEPSIRNDFFSILDLAYLLGYKIILETNARIFSNNELCAQLRYYNLNITTHIECYKPRVHDLIIRIPHGFEEAVAGIKNLKANCRKIIVKIMLTKWNYKFLLNTVKFISKFKIDTIWCVFLTPQGNARLYFDKVVPTYSEISPFLSDALTWLKNNSKTEIVIENFPYCFVGPGFINSMMENPVDEKKIMFGIYPACISLDEHKYYIYEERPKQKTKFPQCKNCRFNNLCEGVYKEYVRKIGKDEFIPVLKW